MQIQSMLELAGHFGGTKAKRWSSEGPIPDLNENPLVRTLANRDQLDGNPATASGEITAQLSLWCCFPLLAGLHPYLIF
jgi:hypothetical protein